MRDHPLHRDSCTCGHACAPQTQGQHPEQGHGRDGCACHTHGHEHTHEHGGCTCCGEHAADRGEWLRIGAAALLFFGSFFVPVLPKLLLLASAYLLIGLPILKHAFRGLFSGHLFDETVLMAVATIGAIAIGDYAEAVAVLLFYRVGEALQGMAVRRSRERIGAAVALHPDRASVLRDGIVTEVDPETVAVGEQILVGVGERVPLDGVVIHGESRLDCSGLTGESETVAVHVGSAVPAGSVNAVARLTVETTALAADSATGRLLRAIEDAAVHKPKLERFITRFSRIYTPCVIVGALLLAVIPSVLGMGTFSEWLRRALTFLVISCPCALVLSIPLTFFAGLGAASKNGILLKGADVLEAAARVKTAVFDKTGTLTNGVFAVQGVHAEHMTEAELLSYAAAVEADSPHPVAAAIRAAAAAPYTAEEVREHAGRGVSGKVLGKTVLVGTPQFLAEHGVAANRCAGTLVAVDGVCVGGIELGDRLRPSAIHAFAALRQEGFYTAILTGDREEAAKAIADVLQADEVHARLLPEEKLRVLRDVRARRGAALFLGDGINDAPVLAGADIGMAMAEHGTEMAAEAADALLLTEDLTKVPLALRIGRKTMRVARENIVLALGIKLAALVLAALGIASMWIAVLADVGAALLCVVHALRVFGTEG